MKMKILIEEDEENKEETNKENERI